MYNKECIMNKYFNFAIFQKKGDLDLTAITEYSGDGEKMTHTVTIKQDPTIKAVRGFTRLS